MTERVNLGRFRYVRGVHRVAAFLIVLLFAGLARAGYTPPPIRGYVTDTAGVLTPETTQRFDKKLAEYRLCSKNHVAVFIAKSLEGNSIEDVAYAAFNAWHIGEAKKDNGVLLVIAPNERKDRIETGRGAEGALTDLQANDILRQHVSPRLKESNFDAAVDEGTSAIGEALQGDGGACAMTRVFSAPTPTTTPTLGSTATSPSPATTAPKTTSEPTYTFHEPIDHPGERVVVSVLLAIMAFVAAFGAKSGFGLVLSLIGGPIYYAFTSTATTTRGDIDLEMVYGFTAFFAIILAILDWLCWTKLRGDDWGGGGAGGGGGGGGGGSSDWTTGSSTSSTFDFSSSSSSSSSRRAASTRPIRAAAAAPAAEARATATNSASAGASSRTARSSRRTLPRHRCSWRRGPSDTCRASRRAASGARSRSCTRSARRTQERLLPDDAGAAHLFDATVAVGDDPVAAPEVRRLRCPRCAIRTVYAKT